ncbi:hypothetical protein CQ14_21025 [Bradyrhizobium lablabi]|uniref:Uncharacterized protein n=1 Tax=Bradyrhizobium lablabi TaxID=722472 RepID=A0A0R3N205_9BRAD|nr:hypothetical protein CQ14_21025 [Bradyrhizobium lablabi]
MVIPRSVARPRNTSSPIKKASSVLTRDLESRAAVALDEARGMPPGHERNEATHKALVLRNAVELHEFLCGKRDAAAG